MLGSQNIACFVQVCNSMYESVVILGLGSCPKLRFHYATIIPGWHWITLAHARCFPASIGADFGATFSAKLRTRHVLPSETRSCSLCGEPAWSSPRARPLRFVPPRSAPLPPRSPPPWPSALLALPYLPSAPACRHARARVSRLTPAIEPVHVCGP